MTEKKYKIPMIFDYILVTLIVSMLVAVFLGDAFFAVTQFLTLLLMIVFLMLDKKYRDKLSDHRVTYFLFNVSVLICLISILGFYMDTYLLPLNIILAVDVVFEICLIIVDVFLTPDGFFDKNWCRIINATKLCTMICLNTYLNGVVSICYSIFALAFILINIIIKAYASIRIIKKQKAQKMAGDNLETVADDKADSVALDIAVVDKIIYETND